MNIVLALFPAILAISIYILTGLCIWHTMKINGADSRFRVIWIWPYHLIKFVWRLF